MRQASQNKNSFIRVLSHTAAMCALVLSVGFATSVSAAPTECIDAQCPTNNIPIGCPGNAGPTATPPKNCPTGTTTSTTPATSPTTTSPTKPAPVRIDGKPYCGQYDPESSRNQSVVTSFDIGCRGQGNPITDALFAIIRFLSLGVGLIIVGSITFAGIQYTASRGDPKATSEAINRIRSNVVAFIIYIFSFAILNFLIPKGFFGQ